MVSCSRFILSCYIIQFFAQKLVLDHELISFMYVRACMSQMRLQYIVRTPSTIYMVSCSCFSLSFCIIPVFALKWVSNHGILSFMCERACMSHMSHQYLARTISTIYMVFCSCFNLSCLYIPIFALKLVSDHELIRFMCERACMSQMSQYIFL